MVLSFVIPIYNEEHSIRALVDGIIRHSAGHACQVVLVNDGSTDGSAAIVSELAAQHANVEAEHFETNRGKTAALAAGIVRATGDVVFTMDSDLQDDPAEIPRFLDKLDEDYDMICGWKSTRHDPPNRVLASRIYNGFVTRLFGVPIHDINCGFKAMRRETAQALDLHHDYHRLIPVLAAKQGFKVGEIEVAHRARQFGQSKYGPRRYWNGLRDVARLWWETRGGRSP